MKASTNYISGLITLLLAFSVSAADEYEAAVTMIKQENYKVAATLLDALREKDDRPKVRYALGYCREKLGDEAAAVNHYRDALALNLNTNRDPDATERAMKRLYELRPAVGKVLKRAWDLRDEAAKAPDSEKRYLQGASVALFRYALSADVSADAQVATGGTAAEGATGLRTKEVRKERHDFRDAREAQEAFQFSDKYSKVDGSAVHLGGRGRWGPVHGWLRTRQKFVGDFTVDLTVEDFEPFRIEACGLRFDSGTHTFPIPEGRDLTLERKGNRLMLRSGPMPRDIFWEEEIPEKHRNEPTIILIACRNPKQGRLVLMEISGTVVDE